MAYFLKISLEDLAKELDLGHRYTRDHDLVPGLPEGVNDWFCIASMDRTSPDGLQRLTISLTCPEHIVEFGGNFSVPLELGVATN